MTAVPPPAPTGAQFTPLPENPGLHWQVREPGVLVQVALESQPPFAVAHSFTSPHWPLEQEKPAEHEVQVLAWAPHTVALWVAKGTQVPCWQQPAQLAGVQEGGGTSQRPRLQISFAPQFSTVEVY